MRQKKKIIGREVRVGAVIGLGVIIIVAFVFAIGGQRKMFGDKVTYKILFDSTSGLFEGDPVLLTGVEIGNVLGMSQSDSSYLQDLNYYQCLRFDAPSCVLPAIGRAWIILWSRGHSKPGTCLKEVMSPYCQARIARRI